MAGITQQNLALGHFGRQMKKERTSRGWSLPELSQQMAQHNGGRGINHGHLSRVERGVRPPTEKIAELCDKVFPGRRGWFTEYYRELTTWAPPGFRDWPEYEDKAVTIREWSPMIVTGMLQTEGYATGMLAVHPGATDEVIAARLTSRMERQRRILYRDEPPTASYLIDHAALYRLVGSPEVMAGQCDHLLEVASLPHVTLQVFPSVACPATQGGFLLADNAAFAETVVGGYVYASEDTSTWLSRLFDTLRSESYRASESAAIIRRARETWTSETTGARAATAGPTAATA